MGGLCKSYFVFIGYFVCYCEQWGILSEAEYPIPEEDKYPLLGNVFFVGGCFFSGQPFIRTSDYASPTAGCFPCFLVYQYEESMGRVHSFLDSIAGADPTMDSLAIMIVDNTLRVTRFD